jgi:aerobic carbon-monoxide dehydrogenase small subunit
MSEHDHQHAGKRNVGADGTFAPPHGLLPAGPRITVAFELNGTPVKVRTAPMRRLLDVLRTELGHTGTKEGCGEGECGACTVLLDGEPVNACLISVLQCEGRAVKTVEGLANHGVLHPVQEAFRQHGGAQCGICTPGMLVTAAWLVDRGLPAGGIREGIAGNICRCTGYGAIVDSVQAAITACQRERNPNDNAAGGQ